MELYPRKEGKMRGLERTNLQTFRDAETGKEESKKISHQRNNKKAREKRRLNWGTDGRASGTK